MSRASELMDSIKFRKVMDDLIDVWGDVKSGATDEQMAEALQAVLDMAMPTFGELRSAPAVAAVIERQRGIKVGFDQAAADMQLKQDLEAGIYKDRPRGIKALIPVPEIENDLTFTETEALKNKLRKVMPEIVKPKRKRRTKAEMEAARGEEAAERPLRKNERIVPPSEDENQKQAAPHIVAMLAKVQAKADVVPGPVFDVAFDVGEGMFIQELPAYLEASGKFGVLENKGLNSQSRQWVVKIGRK